MTAVLPQPLAEALARPDGARWVKCALQVNPFGYFGKGRKAPASDEETYNRDLVHALLQDDVELIALTDHWRARSAESLRGAASSCSTLPSSSSRSARACRC